MPLRAQTGLILRLADAADSPRCADIFLSGRRDAFPWHPPEMFRLRDYYDSVADEEVWVAVTAEGVVGFVSAALPDNTIRHLFVDAPWRNRGIGRELIGCALGHLGTVAQLRCAARNLGARAFYQRNGWQEVTAGTAADGDFVLYRKTAGS
ncbi:MAG: GNAT family N-acetyltransferase [Rhodospirillaceae bacterium]